ncbi:MAG: type II toxin-antitoxin system PemK/MazF family toxin [Mycobacteriaceae bacterium]|nr:type II toxin-antitoxin system PemK/MazF family toxin [Mycobacteriaceae bacterium]
MASPRKSGWQTLQQFAQNLVFSEAPKLLRQLQAPSNHAAVQRGIERSIKMGVQVITSVLTPPATPLTAGRPVTNISFPTAQRARTLIYAPNLTGRTNPGEVVWTWVSNDGNPAGGQDCPVLVVGREHRILLGLLISHTAEHANDSDFVEIDSSSWDYENKPSWIRLDRVLDVPEESIRREGTILPRDIFEVVASRLRTDYSWR